MLSLEKKIKKAWMGLSAIMLAGSMTLLAGRDFNKIPYDYSAQANPQAADIVKSRLSPQYERTLSKVIMHAKPDVAYQQSLIESLPSYTEITMLTPESLEPYTRNTLGKMKIDQSRVHITPYDDDFMWRSMWAQDIFSVLPDENGTRLVLPKFFSFPEYKEYNGLYPPSQSTDGFKSFLEKQGFKVSVADAYFEGGNLTYDYADDKKLLFVGDSNFINAKLEVLSDLHRRIAMTELKNDFNMDNEFVLGTGQAQTTMFHLDQPFAETGYKEVMILDLSDATDRDIDQIALDLASLHEMGKPESKESKSMRLAYPVEMAFLDETPDLSEEGKVKKILETSKDILDEINSAFNKLGYNINRVPINPWQVLHFQSPLNGIPYKDKISGKKTALVPIFPDSKDNYDIDSTWNKAALDAYKKQGFETIPVVNRTWRWRGNLHCLVNVYE
jgi:hypothetical protein